MWYYCYTAIWVTPLRFVKSHGAHMQNSYALQEHLFILVSNHNYPLNKSMDFSRLWFIDNLTHAHVHARARTHTRAMQTSVQFHRLLVQSTNNLWSFNEDWIVYITLSTNTAGCSNTILFCLLILWKVPIFSCFYDVLFYHTVSVGVQCCCLATISVAHCMY
jgi:hypothetical protein